jgi:hypothetical protein
MNSGDSKNLGSSYKLSINLFSPWETPITFHVDDIIQLERSTQERKVAHISFLKQSSKAKNKRDIEMTLFLHSQVKEAASELPKKSLKQKIFFYQTLKKLLPLFLDHREEKIENLIAEFKGWIDLASSLVTNSVHSTIVLLGMRMSLSLIE